MVRYFCWPIAAGAMSAAVSAAARLTASFFMRFSSGVFVWPVVAILRGALERGGSGMDGRCDAPDDLVQLGAGGDEGRGEQDVVAALAVDRAAHRVAHEAALHRLGLDLGVQLRRGVEWALGRAVLDQLDAHEEAAAADVAHVRMRIEGLVQRA